MGFRLCTLLPDVSNPDSWGTALDPFDIEWERYISETVFVSLKSRVNKENRAAGILENFSEGEKYAEHGLRKFVRNRSPEIMPSINSFFADPK